MSNKLLKKVTLIVIADIEEDFDYIASQVQEISYFGFPGIPNSETKLQYSRTLLQEDFSDTEFYSQNKIAYLFEGVKNKMKDDIELVYEYKREIITTFTPII